MKGLQTTLGQVKGQISDVAGTMKETGEKMKSSGMALSTGVTAPIVAAVGAIGICTDKAVKYQNDMNQVFTLLPNITKPAMEKMSQDALDFSKKYGASTDQVTEAMYQSISAGVDQSKIFDFMSIAQRAAIGGNTDLVTSVNGLSSVVNGYGAANLSASQAADIMFTGVRLGKTTVKELSEEYKNVVPVASSLKIGLGDVTAAIAAMTSQGVPTGEATNELRQMLVELSKSGSGLAVTFENLTGKSFADFIAGGGTMQEALKVLGDNLNKTIPDADKLQKSITAFSDPTSKLSKDFNKLTGESFSQFKQQGGTVEQALDKMGIKYGDTAKRISDYAGSVEAGNAMLMLTGPGAEIFSNNLKEMGKSAGEADKAYNKMDEDQQTSINKINATMGAIMIEVGDKFLPLLAEKVFPFIQNVLLPGDRGPYPLYFNGNRYLFQLIAYFTSYYNSCHRFSCSSRAGPGLCRLIISGVSAIVGLIGGLSGILATVAAVIVAVIYNDLGVPLPLSWPA